MNFLNFINKVSNFLESLNLLIFTMIISGYHYSQVFGRYEPIYIAIFYAAIFDLGHYQIVSEAFRYSYKKGKKFFPFIIRWGFSIATTYASFYFHSEYYSQFNFEKQITYSSILPLFIFVLAWYRLFKGQAEEQLIEEDIEDYVERITNKTTCEICGEVFDNKNQIPGHMNKHRKELRKYKGYNDEVKE